MTKKSSEDAFVLAAIYKKGGNLKYSEVFQCDNEGEFKSEVTKLLEIHDADIRRATTKYTRTHTAFVDAFEKVLEKQLCKPIDTHYY